MTAIVLIGDSIPSGTPSTMADDRHRVAYLMTELTGHCVYDMCVPGTFITGRDGFPNSPLSGGLRDKFMVVKDYIADAVILMQGHNDRYNNVPSKDVLKCVKLFARHVMKETHIPKKMIICGLVTSLDAEERPYVPAFNAELQALCSQLHSEYIAGKYESDCVYVAPEGLSDCTVEANMADGIHRSDVGRADLAANLRDVLIAEGIW